MDYKPICCIIGAVLINLTLGTFYSIGNVFTYVDPYMRANGNTNVSSGDAAWITSAYLLGQGFFLIIGAYVERLLDSRVACIVGCVLHCLSTYLTMWAIDVSIVAVIFLYGFGSGAGCGSSYIASIIAAQKWYPNKKGFVTGIIVAGFGFGGLIFTFLQTLYVNPGNLKADPSGNFPEEVYKRVPKLFMFMGIVFTVAQTIGCALAFPPPPSPLDRARVSNENSGTTIVEEALPNMKSVLSAFKYRIFYIIGLMMMLVVPGVTFVNSLGKRYGQIYINDDKFLATVVAVASIANASGRLTWGYLLDKFSFSTCYTAKILLFATLIALFPFGFILSSKALYMIWMSGMFFGFSGSFVLFPVFVEQVFGVKYHGIVYGILYVGLAIASILTSIAIKFGVNPDGATTRTIPCAVIAVFYIASLILYRYLIPVDRLENALQKRKELTMSMSNQSLSNRKDLLPLEGAPKENSLGSIVRFAQPP